ncbi:MAG TPA: tetratricopeptide repeat protein [Coxiellaceae bacterium]|nr:tetratricopeptide repeat protein [Coxiellaceae bacterium]
MDEDEFIVLEENVALSQSKIWNWHQNFYLDSGVGAWHSKVPHYVTSNPFIANAYVQVVIEFLNEHLIKNPDSIQHTFYFLELGAGHSKFSFLFLKRFTELRALLNPNLKFCYLITDFSEKNLNFASTHPQLQEYIAAGVLDFACFDIEKCNSLQLRLRQTCLSQASIRNPLIVVANYILDSLRKDAFYVDERYRLSSQLINIKTKASNLVQGDPLNLENLLIEFSSAPVGAQHYLEQEFNHILAEYNQYVQARSFSLPVTAFRLIDYLINLSNDRLLLISSDKGYLTHEEFSTRTEPHIAFHGGCFSLMTNFDAIARYFKVKGGDACLQASHPGLGSCIYISAGKFADLPKTQLAFATHLNQFSPQDYFNLCNMMIANVKTLSLEVLNSCLNLSGYDPYVFHRLLPRLKADVAAETSSLISALKRAASLVTEQFYFMPGCEDIYFDVGLFFHHVKEYEQALDYYQRSQTVFEANFNTTYNIGLCYYHLNDFEQAENFFLKALEFSPNSLEAKDWLKYVRRRLG